MEALTLESGLPQYSTVVRRNCVLGYERAMRLPSDNPRRIAASHETCHRLQRTSSWKREAKREAELLGLSDEKEQLSPIVLAPWEWSSREVSGWVALGADIAKTASEEEQLRAGSRIVRDYEATVTIYTDGSVAGDLQSSGSAAVVTVGPPEDCRRMVVLRSSFRGVTSSFESEVRALLLAVEWLESVNVVEWCREREVRFVVGPTVLICSNSRAALAALKEVRPGQRTSVWHLRGKLAELSARVSLQWVPAHCGLKGNEMADEEANAARRANLCWCCA